MCALLVDGYLKSPGFLCIFILYNVKKICKFSIIQRFFLLSAQQSSLYCHKSFPFGEKKYFNNLQQLSL